MYLYGIFIHLTVTSHWIFILQAQTCSRSSKCLNMFKGNKHLFRKAAKKKPIHQFRYWKSASFNESSLHQEMVIWKNSMPALGFFLHFQQLTSALQSFWNGQGVMSFNSSLNHQATWLASGLQFNHQERD